MQKRGRALPGLVLSLALAVAAVPTTAKGVALYSVTDLGAGMYASGINESGQIAGSGGLWTDGVWRNLGFAAADVNDSGQVVGENYFWSGGNATQLDFNAVAINNSGQVVGSRPGEFSYPQAVVWDAANGEHELPIPGRAYDINNQGQVLYSTGPVIRWSEGEGNVVLGPEYAYALNDRGWATGENMGYPIAGGYGAVLYIPEENGTSIISLYNDPSNVFEAAGTGINNAGQIVGGSQLGAFTWFNGKMNFLDDLIAPNSGWSLDSASDLNESTQIVGTGTLNGEKHGYLLLPQFDGVATEASDYTFSARLGEALGFQFWLDGLEREGDLDFQLLVRNADGSTRLIGSGEALYGRENWQDALFHIPAELIGTEVDLVLSLGEASDSSTLYLRELINAAAPVPEPGTLLLLGGGLAIFAAGRRRKA